MTAKNTDQPEVDNSSSPSWTELHVLAESQQGVFSVDQAAHAGFSNQLLHKHVRAGNLQRVQRGIYRLTRFPEAAREQEDLVVAWLWSGREGVVSHESALALQGLSDALPSNIHLTVPLSWASRRIRVPEGVVLSMADVAPDERVWVGAVPVTTPVRTILDLAAAHGDASIIDSAIREGLPRGLVTLAEVAPAVTYLANGRGGWTRVRPDAIEGLGDSYRIHHFSGICRRRPPSDWRIEAERLAARHGARLRAADCTSDTRSMTLDLVWPISVEPPPPELVQRDAAESLGWM
ncbi:MAG: type IV toxin-antitoxin system AbiEi family antitoxin domain-containing protein [Alphaproteobacteria bacterium]|nr:type IV toxin-antitoxin system AbiEi family antitoxin domain-containing protein [Alphaproteobacteria bacterium]